MKPEYITKESAIEAACEGANEWDEGFTSPYRDEKIAEYICDIPAVDVVPVRRGQWEKDEDFDKYGGGRYIEWTCSECYFKAKGDWATRDTHVEEPPVWPYCPNCGAKMDVGRADNGN